MENQAGIEQPKKTGNYKVESIYLLESHFSFVAGLENIKLNNPTNEYVITPEQHDTLENIFLVGVTLDFKCKNDENIICNSTIKMMGRFEKVGEPELSEESFKKINAPAIIYPFIREHLHNTCLKAGSFNILLPTINFKP